MQTVIVFDKTTKEIIAQIPLVNGEKAILRGDVDFEIRDSE